MPTYEYRIGPLEWATEGNLSFWRAPSGYVGMVDLGVQTDFDGAGSDRGVGFFAVQVGSPLSALTWPIIGIGDFREILTTSLMQDAWQSELGYRPQGDKLVDLLFDHLTNGSDPDWGNACKPLMPTVAGNLDLHMGGHPAPAGHRDGLQLVAGNLDLHMGGHSLVKRERFRFGVHGHTAKVEAMLQRDYALIHADAKAGRMRGVGGVDLDFDRRVLDYWLDKYKIDKSNPAQWKRLVPPNLRGSHPGPLPHQTTITESFNTSDGDTLGPDLSWTELDGDWDIASNQASCNGAGGSGVGAARADSDLSSDDHYSQADLHTLSGGKGYGSAARYSSSSNVYYMFWFRTSDNSGRIYKYNGSFTELTGGTSITASLPEAYKTECDGSTIKGYQAGVERRSVTDTSITGNTRGGIIGQDAPSAVVDAFEAADLSPSGTSGDGSAAGTATASGEGQSTAVAAGTAAGIATDVAAGSSTAEADGASAGVAAAAGEGQSTAVANGSAAGTSTAAGVSGSVISGDGSSSGSSAANAAGSSVVSATAAAAGIGSVAGSGKSTVVAAAVSAGLSAISAIGFATAAAIAVAAGVATATGQSSVMSVSGPYRIAKAEAFVPTAVPQAFAGGAVKRQIFPGGAAAAQSEPQ